MRIDVWLWAVRLTKSRSVAAALCRSGRVRINDKVAKASSSVAVGDRVTWRDPLRDRDIEVVELLVEAGGGASRRQGVPRPQPGPADAGRAGGRGAARPRGGAPHQAGAAGDRPAQRAPARLRAGSTSRSFLAHRSSGAERSWYTSCRAQAQRARYPGRLSLEKPCTHVSVVCPARWPRPPSWRSSSPRRRRAPRRNLPGRGAAPSPPRPPAAPPASPPQRTPRTRSAPPRRRPSRRVAPPTSGCGSTRNRT